MTAEANAAVGALLDAMATMTSEERVAVVDLIRDRYCTHCGDKGGHWTCHCENDD